MGDDNLNYTTLIVRNPSTQKQAEVRAIIDSGASLTTLTKDIIQMLQLEEVGHINITIADGSDIRTPVYIAELEESGALLVGNMIMEGGLNLLGMRSLQRLGYSICKSGKPIDTDDNDERKFGRWEREKTQRERKSYQIMMWIFIVLFVMLLIITIILACVMSTSSTKQT